VSSSSRVLFQGHSQRSVSAWMGAHSARTTPVMSSLYLTRGYAEAAATTVSPTRQATLTALEKIKNTKPKKIKKSYPPVFFKEEPEEQRVEKAKKMLAEYQPTDNTVIGVYEHYLADVLTLLYSIKTHPEKNALVDKACALVHERKGTNKASIISLTRLAKVLGDLHRLEDALKVLDIFAEQNLIPNTTTANVLIRACGINQNVDKAREIFNKMKRPYQKRNASTIAALVDALSRNGKWDEAREAIMKMESEYKVQPHWRVFRRYLFQCVVQKQKDRGLSMLAYMKDKQIDGSGIKWLKTTLTDPSFGKN